MSANLAQSKKKKNLEYKIHLFRIEVCNSNNVNHIVCLYEGHVDQKIINKIYIMFRLII